MLTGMLAEIFASLINEIKTVLNRTQSCNKMDIVNVYVYIYWVSAKVENDLVLT